jgi:hypothetical protein
MTALLVNARSPDPEFGSRVRSFDSSADSEQSERVRAGGRELRLFLGYGLHEF